MIDGKLSLVLPAHNEAENIEQVVSEALIAVPRHFAGLEVIVVNDGSSDETPDIVRSMSQTDTRVRLVDHPVNRGYGAALRSGFDASTGDYVMVMDSDRQFDIGDIVYMVPFISQFDMVAGYRIQRNDPLHRTVFGKTFRLAMRTLFGVQLKDIDCAFKVMRGDILRSLPLTSEGAMISTELMARWAQVGATWSQVGVHHYPRTAGQQSGGSIRVIFRAMRDVPLLWLRLRREDRDVEPASLEDEATSSSRAGSLLPTLLVTLVLAVVVGFFVRWMKSRSDQG
ncbi:MAG: glycosyltransferase family 2 protein [Sphaerobacteraceae bacterium]|nr:MAG: glycosyltransferase family 2 protein [Sphaerobacteraceae bacterium]